MNILNFILKVYSYHIGLTIAFALGIWAGNWLTPLIVKGRSFTDGFFIGMIAAILFLIFYPWFTYPY